MAKIDNKIKNVINLYINQLHEEGINVVNVYLFGSYATNTHNQWSDIDIAIIASNLNEGRFKDGLKLANISRTIDTRIEPIAFNPNTFLDDDPLVYEIKSKGILLKF